MSLRAMLWALNDAPATDPGEVLVLLALADHAADDGTGAWPSRATIAGKARCSVSTVQRRLNTLELAGLIRRGEQRLVAHLRQDRRPVVWDLALTGCQPAPSSLARGVTGDATGVQVERHGVSPVAHKPSFNQEMNLAGAAALSTPVDSPGDEHPSALVDEHLARASAARLAGQLRADAIAECELCDDAGYQGTVLCDHDPAAPARAARGRALVAGVLARNPPQGVPSSSPDTATRETP